MATNIAINTVTPRAAATSVTKALKHRRPVMLWGPPGIGKSDVIAQIGQHTNRQVIDIRLALWDPTDIKGMPYLDATTQLMNWSPPSEFPQAADSNAILFFDEIVSAPPAVQAAAYQLILNRRVGKYVLPAGVDMVAAGNREGDRGVTYKMPAPLASRFIHLEMSVSYDDWQHWAVNNAVHADVIGYLGFSKQDLMDFDPRSASRAFACPRTWTFVSELLKDEDGDDEVLMNLVSGAVGDGLAAKFMAHRKVCGRMPKPMDILEGKVDELNIKEISALYSLTVSLCYELKELCTKRSSKWYGYVDNYFKFMMDHFPTELVVMGAKVALSNYNLDIDPTKSAQFDKFFDRFGKYIYSGKED